MLHVCGPYMWHRHLCCLPTQVQATTKHGGTSLGTSLYLFVHIARPKCGKPGLLSMLPTWEYPIAPSLKTMKSKPSLKPSKASAALVSAPLPHTLTLICEPDTGESPACMLCKPD